MPGSFWLFSGSPCFPTPTPAISLAFLCAPLSRFQRGSVMGQGSKAAFLTVGPQQGLGLFGFYQPLLDQTAVELLDVRVHALPVGLSKPHHVLCVQELRAVRMGPGEGRGPGRGRGAGPERGSRGRGREERGEENRETHTYTHRDMSSVTFSVLQSASPPHAPSPLWTCRLLPITNGVQCRQGWGARSVTGAEDSRGKREGTRGGGDGVGAEVGEEGRAPGGGGGGG